MNTKTYHTVDRRLLSVTLTPAAMALFSGRVLACSLAFLVVCLPWAAADMSTAPPAAQCSAVTDERRIDCYPEFGANQAGCESRGCCWGIPALAPEGTTSHDELGMGTPWCFFPDECVQWLECV